MPKNGEKGAGNDTTSTNGTVAGKAATPNKAAVNKVQRSSGGSVLSQVRVGKGRNHDWIKPTAMSVKLLSQHRSKPVGGIRNTKDELRRLINQLSADKLPEAIAAVQSVIDKHKVEREQRPPSPLLAAIQKAPVDDEPETPEEIQVVKAARAELARGDTVSDSELERRLGHGRKS